MFNINHQTFKGESNFTRIALVLPLEPTVNLLVIQLLEKLLQSILFVNFSFIQKRDGTKNKPSINDIILTDGASSGITLMFNLLLKDKNDGVMIPIP